MYNECINTFETEDIADTDGFRRIIATTLQVHLGELDLVDSRISQRLFMSEELLGVVSAPADDALSMSGMPWEVSRTVFRSWMAGCSLLGVW